MEPVSLSGTGFQIHASNLLRKIYKGLYSSGFL